ncbi:MAG: YkgJ family cysteine cluster protein [Methanomassiliicoccaceae archaeon]|jgi:Fe-S-cluster containining protein|nr:YkgJ family cysteine cluster protein [Methanomassiliicoccaceae archaeon]
MNIAGGNMAKYRGKYILDGLDEIPPEMLRDLDLAYDACKQLHDHFPCEMCGRCCHQANITVMDDEVERMASHLNMTADGFTDDFLYREDGRWLFKKSGRCRFLGNDDKCAIWEQRPLICSDFPYLVSKFMSRVYLSIVNGTDIDLSYMEDDWPCTPVIKKKIGAPIEDARRKRVTRSL